MTQVTKARQAALNIMRAIRSGELADRAFAHQADKLLPRDRAWTHELVYGTLRLRGRLDFILSQFVQRELSSLDADVLDILRLACYQLLEMGSVPPYAAVSQAVEQSKSLRKRGAGALINGVLQSIGRSNSKTRKLENSDPVEALSSWGSHPRWLIERWVARFGVEQTEQLVAANNQKPAIYIRPIGISVDEAVARGKDFQLEPVAHVPESLRVASGRVADVLASVPAVVQDPAATLIARYAAPQGGVVADLCAAPGGKAIALADAVRHDGVVIAADVAASRLERALENVQRLGNLPLQFMVADARHPAIKEADLVLIDAPCTGTGTFRRHPDGKWRIGVEDLLALTDLQRTILDGACEIVKVGGVLVYATCSLEPEENQQQVSAFLDRHPNFLRRPPSPWHDADLVDEVGDLVVLPHQHGFDGSFAARLERVA